MDDKKQEYPIASVPYGTKYHFPPPNLPEGFIAGPEFAIPNNKEYFKSLHKAHNTTRYPRAPRHVPFLQEELSKGECTIFEPSSGYPHFSMAPAVVTDVAPPS